MENWLLILCVVHASLLSSLFAFGVDQPGLDGVINTSSLGFDRYLLGNKCMNNILQRMKTCLSSAVTEVRLKVEGAFYTSAIEQ